MRVPSLAAPLGARRRARRSTWSGGSGASSLPSTSYPRTPMDTFASVLAALGRADVDFILVGGLAVAFAGFARVTDDVDILVDADPANLDRMLGVLEGFGEGAANELSADDFPLEEGCVRVSEHFDLDIFTLMSGYTYADLLPMTTTHEVDGVPVRHLTAEGLIRLKNDSLRPKDQLDVAALRAIQRGETP